MSRLVSQLLRLRSVVGSSRSSGIAQRASRVATWHESSLRAIGTGAADGARLSVGLVVAFSPCRDIFSRVVVPRLNGPTRTSVISIARLPVSSTRRITPRGPNSSAEELRYFTRAVRKREIPAGGVARVAAMRWRSAPGPWGSPASSCKSESDARYRRSEFTGNLSIRGEKSPGTCVFFLSAPDSSDAASTARSPPLD